MTVLSEQPLNYKQLLNSLTILAAALRVRSAEVELSAHLYRWPVTTQGEA